MRTSPILGLLICSAIIVNVAEAKPIFIKVFAPSSGYSYQSAPTVSPANTQFISSLITQKLNLLDNFLRAKSSFGSFGFTKTFAFTGPSSTTTTTESPVTQLTTEVNTDFIPEVSSSTQSVSTTTTEDDIATPKPTVHPQRPITTSTTTTTTPSTPVTPVIPEKSTTEEPIEETTSRATNGYSYQTPTSRLIDSNTVRTYDYPSP
ncbi:cell wall integrity and stress response component 4 isoform X1 [Drosophila innubila]|uniref:cell wall integrity and stress response component 4 isoform X1 n=1 Tax=Drosophila innubila TaxID=198719 RepID=UPI00148BFC9A|nr:cell wall integrity and stress response component 4 isoform X1 [Drosophila innubila]